MSTQNSLHSRHRPVAPATVADKEPAVALVGHVVVGSGHVGGVDKSVVEHSNGIGQVRSTS